MHLSATTNMTSHALAMRIKAKALAVGFDLVGIASAEPSHYSGYFRQWLDSGKAGAMAYMAGRFDERTDLGKYLPGAASVICVALNYHVPTGQVPESKGPVGRIARYALGSDYHDLIKKRLHQLDDAICEMAPGVQTRCAVDTAPILERELAARAGIGWIGKNTCIINPRIGSWTFLGEIVTTLALPADRPIADHCGSCTKCIDSCPTQAITAPYELDARRCISYLTIEHRDPIPVDMQEGIGDWLYGCDICQEVCPHNHQPPVAIDPNLSSRFPGAAIGVVEVMNWNDPDYCQKLRNSAMRRVKLPMLKRNAANVANNRHLSPKMNTGEHK